MLRVGCLVFGFLVGGECASLCGLVMMIDRSDIRMFVLDMMVGLHLEVGVT